MSYFTSLLFFVLRFTATSKTVIVIIPEATLLISSKLPTTSYLFFYLFPISLISTINLYDVQAFTSCCFTISLANNLLRLFIFVDVETKGPRTSRLQQHCQEGQKVEVIQSHYHHIRSSLDVAQP